MPAVAFDTHRYVKRLEEAGVPEKQAEAQAEALSEALGFNLATKLDIKELNLKTVGLSGKVGIILWVLAVVATGTLLWMLLTIGQKLG